MSIQDRAAGCKVFSIKEAVEIRLHSRGFNGDRSFILSWSWYLTWCVQKVLELLK
jgi:hypothetical protein